MFYYAWEVRAMCSPTRIVRCCEGCQLQNHYSDSFSLDLWFIADHHGPPKVNCWQEPMNPGSWKEEQVSFQYGSLFIVLCRHVTEPALVICSYWIVMILETILYSMMLVSFLLETVWYTNMWLSLHLLAISFLQKQNVASICVHFGE